MPEDVTPDDAHEAYRLHANELSKAAAEAAAVLANATAEAASALARATAQAAASTSAERDRKLDVMYDRTTRIYNTMFGDDDRGGLVEDVTKLNTKVSFIQWAGGAGTAALLAAIGSTAVVLLHH